MTARPRDRRISSADRCFNLTYAGLALVYLAPLFVTRFLPAFDLPHHLAIVDALVKANQPDSPYSRHFVVGLEFAPFAVHVIVLRALAAAMPLDIAAKVLVGAIVLALPLATARLLRVSGRDTMPALLALPLVYSLPLHYGLIAFVAALPLLIWMLAEASNEPAWRERPVQHALVLGVLALVTFFAHLEAWAIGVVAAGAAVLLAAVPWRTRVWGLAALAPSLLACGLYVATLAGDPRVGASTPFARAVLTARARELAEHGLLADLVGRIRVAPIHLLRAFNDGSDVLAAQVFFGLIAAGLLVGLANWRFRRPRARPRLTPAVGLVLVGVVAYSGLPHHAPPDAFSVYPRFAVVLALLLLLTVPTRLWNAHGRTGKAVTALVVLLVAIHGVNLTRHYAAFGRELADFEHVLDASPPGLASGGLVFDAESRVMNIGGIFTGLPAYYVTERTAPRSSTWLYYCAWPQLPCHMRHPDHAPPLPFFSNPSEFDARRALEDLELLFVRGGPPAEQLFGRETPRVRLLVQYGSWRAFVRR